MLVVRRRRGAAVAGTSAPPVLPWMAEAPVEGAHGQRSRLFTTGCSMLQESSASRTWVGESRQPVVVKTRRIEFGNYKGRPLGSLPHGYLAWMATQLRGGQKTMWAHLAKEVLHQRDVCCSSRMLKESLDRAERGIEMGCATYASLLRLCGSTKSLLEGKRLHALLMKSRFGRDRLLGNLVLEMYGKCGALEDARAAFEKMSRRNVFTWTIMIGAYAEHGYGNEALLLFQEMLLEGVTPNRITFVNVLSACANPEALVEGKWIHGLVLASGLESDIVVGTALVSMYGKCGSLVDARKSFDAMTQRDVVTWSAMITAYAQHGQGKLALQLFDEMQRQGVVPNKVTFLSILSACAGLVALAEGKQMHAHIVASGFQSDITVGNALVNMYGKCNSVKDARKMFDTMLERDVVSWTSIIAAYAQDGQGREALLLFQQMRREGVDPDKFTVGSILSACASQFAFDEGKRMHDSIVSSEFKSDAVLEAALLNMYSKCGSWEDAWRAFDAMPERDVISWNAMLAACARHGQGKEAILLFHQMQLEGEIPDTISFISVLSACSHAGLVDDGHLCFVSMNQDHGITPTIEHYHCMIDLLGRAGLLDEGEDLIIKMPYEPTAVTWETLLGACRMHFDVKRGQRVADNAFGLDPDNATPYVLLSNMYAAASKWDDVAKVRKMVVDKGLKKQPGYSSIEIRNKAPDFFCGR